ncbi:STM4504/CBY_0614 family protein [Aurantimonas sp. A3-2-R12]|uniref:STM4504/CBY_0614 family protein n=1 Tax=Aurantimonas sp. A3-2-R12 TaxID=3114362 RepID=UPI002E1865B6|nr:hypothetical protein [Aurantimonas sp. A3-2-R12]
MMGFDIFSKRAKRELGTLPDVYQYEEFPQTLRIQITSGLIRTVNLDYYNNLDKEFQAVHDILSEEYGMKMLFQSRSSVYYEDFFRWFIAVPPCDQALDCVEFFDRIVETKDYLDVRVYRELVNFRFREAGFGYRLDDQGHIIKISNEYLHADVTSPALLLLSDPAFRGANDEFQAAHADYKNGDFSGCLVECHKCFESTMKIIRDRRGWTSDGDTSSKLVACMLDNGLIEAYWKNQMMSLRSMLESAIPTPRNKKGGHGQGGQPHNVPDHLAAFCLHLTAATVQFLVQSFKSLP